MCYEEKENLIDIDERNIEISDLNKFLHETAIDTIHHVDCVRFKKILNEFKKLYIKTYPREWLIFFRKDFNFKMMNSLLKKHNYDFCVQQYLSCGLPIYKLDYTGKVNIDVIYPAQSLTDKWRMDKLLYDFDRLSSSEKEMTEDELINLLHSIHEHLAYVNLGFKEFDKCLDLRYVNTVLGKKGIPFVFKWDDNMINKLYRFRRTIF